jgi:hypothetical protein
MMTGEFCAACPQLHGYGKTGGIPIPVESPANIKMLSGVALQLFK